MQPKIILTLEEEQILQFKILKEENILHQLRVQIARRHIGEALQTQTKKVIDQAHHQIETPLQEALADLEAAVLKVALEEEGINIKKYTIS